MKKLNINKTLERPEPPPAQSQSQSDFSRTLTRVAVAQICQSVGYVSAKSSALQTLATVAALYLKSLTSVAASCANRFGRTQCNLLDIVAAFEDLQSVTGFKGGSVVARPLLKSWVLGDVIQFVDRVEEIPFAQAIRRLKVESFGFGTSVDVCENNHNAATPANVPMWLPQFPDAKTYKEQEEDDDKGGKSGSGEVLFPNCRVAEVSVNGKKVGKRGGCGELRSDRCRVKFRLDAKRKCGAEVGEDVCCNNVVCLGGGVGVSSDEKEKEPTLKEKVEEKKKEKVYVRRGLSSKSGEKRIVQGRKELL